MSTKAKMTVGKSFEVIIVHPECLNNRFNNLNEQISHRAHDLYESRGRENGHDLEDWLRAESELFCRVPVTIKESNDHLTVLAELAECNAPEIEISAEPQRVFISGKRYHDTERTEKKADYTQQAFAEFIRGIELPAEVDPLQVKAILENGVLNITLPKTGINKAADTE